MTSKTDLILKVVDDGFKGVHKRLDRMNGTIEKHDIRLDRQAVALARVDERDKMPFKGAGLFGAIFTIIYKILGR